LAGYSCRCRVSGVAIARDTKRVCWAPGRGLAKADWVADQSIISQACIILCVQAIKIPCRLQSSLFSMHGCCIFGGNSRKACLACRISLTLTAGAHSSQRFSRRDGGREVRYRSRHAAYVQHTLAHAKCHTGPSMIK
jgi:hypothetical protein